MRILPFAPLLTAALLSGCGLFRPAAPEYDSVEFPSGLVVRDLVVPERGEPARVGDTVAVHYELFLTDRTRVDSSVEAGAPLRFELGSGAVPRGLDEGILGMRLFGRRRLTVPSALAFGAEGRPPRIPPDATVVFDVELMELAPR
ncbi:MAG: FKBP-type peptidyl-prolyl cis-trans isomerase [Planctomycetota bacterium]